MRYEKHNTESYKWMLDNNGMKPSIGVFIYYKDNINDALDYNEWNMILEDFCWYLWRTAA